MRAYDEWPRFFKPKPRRPLGTYIQRLNKQLEQLDERNVDEVYTLGLQISTFISTVKIYRSHVMTAPSEPHARKSLRSKDRERIYLKEKLPAKSERSFAQNRSFTDGESVNDSDDSFDHDERIARDRTWNDERQSLPTQYRCRTVSPERRQSPLKRKSETRKVSKSRNERDEANDLSWLSVYITNSMSRYPHVKMTIIIAIIVILPCMLCLNMSEKSAQHATDNTDSILFNSMKKIRAKFHNQESDIWNDVSSAINEMISPKTPKVPSIILLYANETHTMDCLATEIAHASSAILRTDDDPMQLNPENFGDDPGKIIVELSEKLPNKKVVIIRNILDINAKAIRALHNLCDRINPLVGEAVYILTMQTSDYESARKPLAFVEEQMYRKLSRNIDQDILAALVTRITDGAIISVQPEPHLRYCN